MAVSRHLQSGMESIVVTVGVESVDRACVFRQYFYCLVCAIQLHYQKGSINAVSLSTKYI